MALRWFFGVSPKWVRGKLELLRELDLAINHLAAFPLYTGQLLPARPDRGGMNAVFGGKQIRWARPPRDLNDLLSDPLHAVLGRGDDQNREGVSSVARRQFCAAAVGFVRLDLLGPRNKVGRPTIDFNKVAGTSQCEGRIGQYWQIFRATHDSHPIEARSLALWVLAGQQVIAEPVAQLLAAELEGSAQGRIEDTDRDAMLEVLDRVLARVFVPELLKLNSSAITQKFRAGLGQHIGIWQAVEHHRGTLD